MRIRTNFVNFRAFYAPFYVIVWVLYGYVNGVGRTERILMPFGGRSSRPARRHAHTDYIVQLRPRIPIPKIAWRVHRRVVCHVNVWVLEWAVSSVMSSLVLSPCFLRHSIRMILQLCKRLYSMGGVRLPALDGCLVMGNGDK